MLQRVFGVFVAPVRTFASLRSAPRWVDALAVSVLLVSVSTYVFASSDIGARLAAERRVVFAETAGRSVTADQYAASIAREQRGALLTSVVAGVWFVVFTLIAASGALALTHVAALHAGTSASGRSVGTSHALPPLSTNNSHRKLRVPDAPDLPDARSSPRFIHALSIASHVALIPGLAMPCRLLLNVWSGSVGPSTSIGVLLPFLPSDTIWAHLGNTIDLFGLWWAHTLAVGFAIVYLRRPDGLRLLFIGIYLLVAVVQAAAKALVGAPSF